MNSFGKVFSVLEAVIANQEAGLSFSQATAETGLPKASVHRILKGLVELGYLNFNLDNKRYRGTLKLATLGAEVMSHFDLRDYVHPYLLKMRRDTGHTCNLGIKDGNAGIYLDKIEAEDYGIKLYSVVGKSFPLYCTGMGKILLAWAPEEEIEAALAVPLESFTERTITDPGKLRQQLGQIREQGYALDEEEITRGIMCVAAPVFGVGGRLIAAISLTFPSYVYHDRGIAREIEVIKHHAAAIGGAFK